MQPLLRSDSSPNIAIADLNCHFHGHAGPLYFSLLHSSPIFFCAVFKLLNFQTCTLYSTWAALSGMAKFQRKFQRRVIIAAWSRVIQRLEMSDYLASLEFFFIFFHTTPCWSSVSLKRWTEAALTCLYQLMQSLCDCVHRMLACIE